MRAAREVVRRLGLDRLRIRVVVRALGERLRLLVLPPVEEVGREVVEHGRVVRFELVSAREDGEGLLDVLIVEVDHCEPHHSLDAILLQRERPLERLLRHARLAELVVAVRKAEAHRGRRLRVDPEDFAVELEGVARVAAVVLGARLAQQRRHRVPVEGVHLGERLLRRSQLPLGELEHGAPDVGGTLEPVDALG